MGVCIHYFAIPTQSTLYTQISEDLGANALTFALGTNGLFRYQLDDMLFFPGEKEEVINSLITQCRPVLGIQPRKKVDQFLAELERTRTEYPGIEKRVAMIEKCSLEIENKLRLILEKKQISDARLIDHIMWGDASLHPTLSKSSQVRQPGEEVLDLITPTMVQEGARVLASLDLKIVFPDEDHQSSWYQENYARWRNAYLAVAEHREAIIVCIS
ncbi:MAG: hypothetical protein AAFZ17_21195 [Cyanobacteria bacterium J06650_10]